MAPTFFRYDIENITNSSSGEGTMLNFIRFLSNPDPDTYSWYDYLPGLGILMMVFMITFVYLYGRGAYPSSAWWAASLVSMVMAIFLYPMQAVSGFMLSFACVMFLISSVVVWARD